MLFACPLWFFTDKRNGKQYTFLQQLAYLTKRSANDGVLHFSQANNASKEVKCSSEGCGTKKCCLAKKLGEVTSYKPSS